MTARAASARGLAGKRPGWGSPPAKEMIDGSAVTLRISRMNERRTPAIRPARDHVVGALSMSASPWRLDFFPGRVYKPR
jgi:hypothetical protein